MKSRIFMFGLVCIIQMLCGCSLDSTVYRSQEIAIDNVIAGFSPGAITIDIQTDADLNSVRGFANSCTLVMIQSKDINTLKKLKSNPFLVKDIFRGAGGQDDLLKVDRYTTMPGQRTTLHIDRSENARYIALIAGYYPLPQKQHIIIYSIPVISINQGWLRDNWSAHLSPVTLYLRLGGTSITQFKDEKSVTVEDKVGV